VIVCDLSELDWTAEIISYDNKALESTPHPDPLPSSGTEVPLCIEGEPHRREIADCASNTLVLSILFAGTNSEILVSDLPPNPNKACE